MAHTLYTTAQTAAQTSATILLIPKPRSLCKKGGIAPCAITAFPCLLDICYLSVFTPCSTSIVWVMPLDVVSVIFPLRFVLPLFSVTKTGTEISY